MLDSGIPYMVIVKSIHTIKTMNITPSKAIKLECKWCMGSAKSFTCDSQICELNNRTLSHLKRIKLHCLDCVEIRREIKDCTVKLLSEDRLCYLHPYRLGHNPKRIRAKWLQ